MAHYNVIIKNGTVFDGKGNKPEKVDIGIDGEDIKKIGNLQNENAYKIIDAAGKYVSPGFIDLTSHSDTRWTIFSDSTQESLIRQGITTILGGNCGSSIAPLVGKKGLGTIERKVDISKTNINWQTMDELLSELERRKLAVNFATLVGLGTLLDSAGNELKAARFLLEKSLKDGAFGLSTSLGLTQIASFRDEELIELFSVVAKYNGLTKHHLEDEGKNILPAISRLIQITRKSGVRFHISHLKVLGRKSWPLFERALEIMRNARKESLSAKQRDLNLTIDFFPYERTGANLFVLLPSWLRKMEREEIKDILRSPENKKRKEVVEYLKNLTLHYDRIIIASSLRESSIVGKNLLEISKTTGISPEEVILNLLAINNLNVSMFSEVISMEHIKALAKEEYSVIASDGVGYDSAEFKSKILSPKLALPHPRSFGAFPRSLRMFVREEGILNWEQAIYKMTGLPARILGIKNRGVIQKRSKADILVFDPAEISDYATYENPLQFSKGVEHVLINGEIVLSDKRLTGEFAGQVLRKR